MVCLVSGSSSGRLFYSLVLTPAVDAITGRTRLETVGAAQVIRARQVASIAIGLPLISDMVSELLSSNTYADPAGVRRGRSGWLPGFGVTDIFVRGGPPSIMVLAAAAAALVLGVPHLDAGLEA